MEQPKNLGHARETDTPALLPVSVIIAARNEARNLPRCLEALRGFAQVFVIDSQSTAATVEVTRNHGAQVVHFYYHGGWPKKRQWVMDTLPLASDWILLLDADETMTPELVNEIRHSIQNPDLTGYYVSRQQYFLCRHLKHSGKLVETRAVPQGTGPF
jgi:glycosyltransferase involved in cell wall biosynthesis